MDTDELKKNIEKELGLDKFPETIKGEIISRLGENCLKRATLAILEKLTPEERARFEEIAVTGDYQKSHEYASSKIPDFVNFVQNEIKEEVAEFKRLSAVS